MKTILACVMTFLWTVLAMYMLLTMYPLNPLCFGAYEKGAWDTFRYHKVTGEYPSIWWRQLNYTKDLQADEDYVSSYRQAKKSVNRIGE